MLFQFEITVDFKIKHEEKLDSAATVGKRFLANFTSSQQQLPQTKTAESSRKNSNNIVKSVKRTVLQKSLHNIILRGKQTQTDNFSS